jgi:hypothetical protein
MKAVIIPALLLAVCSAPLAAEAESPNQANEWQQAAFAKPEFADPMELAKLLIGSFPESTEGKQQLNLNIINHPSEPDMIQVMVTKDGLLDDSIAAEQWRVNMAMNGEGWVVKSAGKRWQCYRNGNPEQWTIKPCP